MRSRISRVSCAAATVGMVLLAGGTAAAHVTADAPGATQGEYTVVTFRVPTESDTANTTALTVTLPNLSSARTEPIAGWTSKVERNDKQEATAVTWSADPGAPGIGPSQFQRFVIAVGPLPEQNQVSFPATQTYSDGKVVSWDQPMGSDGSEPDHPAPTLKLATGSDEGGDHHRVGGDTEQHAADNTDNTARWLGGTGLVLGLLGVALGLGSVIRGRRA